LLLCREAGAASVKPGVTERKRRRLRSLVIVDIIPQWPY
jgi:hypothetical protein